MATASAAISPATSLPSPATRNAPRRGARVLYIGGVNSFGGLKAQNNITCLGLPLCTQQQFAMVLSSVNSPSKGKGRGGAFSSTCDAAGEIFKIAAIMNALTLIGVAVGFVLLRIEATVEESE